MSRKQIRYLEITKKQFFKEKSITYREMFTIVMKQ